MKRLISSVLTLVMIVTVLQTSAAAVSNRSNNCDLINQQIADTGITFLHISDDKYIYTHEKDGSTYKYIEVITSPNTIKSEVYLLVDHTYKLIDTITTVIELTTVDALSDIGKHFNYDMSLTAQEYDWQYQSTTYGDTSTENKSIVGIATVLAALLGGFAPNISIFMAVAAVIFDMGLRTVYYKIITYKDANNPSALRPTYKWVIHLYSDANRTKEIEGSPITRIIDV